MVIDTLQRRIASAVIALQLAQTIIEKYMVIDAFQLRITPGVVALQLAQATIENKSAKYFQRKIS